MTFKFWWWSSIATRCCNYSTIHPSTTIKWITYYVRWEEQQTFTTCFGYKMRQMSIMDDANNIHKDHFNYFRSRWVPLFRVNLNWLIVVLNLIGIDFKQHVLSNFGYKKICCFRIPKANKIFPAPFPDRLCRVFTYISDNNQHQ